MQVKVLPESLGPLCFALIIHQAFFFSCFSYTVTCLDDVADWLHVTCRDTALCGYRNSSTDTVYKACSVALTRTQLEAAFSAESQLRSTAASVVTVATPPITLTLVRNNI